MVVVDCGFDYKGYATDMTRTFFIGKPNKKFKKVYAAVLAAQKQAMVAIKEDMPAADIDKVARDLLDKAGLGKYFKHSLGHGVGRLVHERPRLSAKSKEILKSGMVVTVEPGVYIPGWGGIRIEDMVLVKPKGCEVLTR